MDPFAFEHKRVPFSVVASRIQLIDMKDFGGKNPMSISLILRNIFMNLPVDTLMTCSLVCKQWKTEARSVLRDFKKSLALIDTCDSLRKFCCDLEEMTDIPYNGISFIVGRHNPSICMQRCRAKDCSSILSGQNFILKFLSLDLPPWRYNCGKGTEKCFRVQFIPKLLHAHAESLEGIVLCRIPTTLKFKETLDFVLPKVTCMWLADATIWFDKGFCVFKQSFRNFLKMTVNLNDINVDMNSTDLRTFPTSFRRCIKTFIIRGTGPTTTCRLATAAPKLVRLEMDHYGYYPDINGFQRHVEAMEKLLTSSRHTLESLKIDTSTAAALYRMDLEVISKLTDFTIIGPPEHFRDDRLLLALQSFNFAQLFPKVYKIQVCHKPVIRGSAAYLAIPGSPEITQEEVEGSDWKRSTIKEVNIKNWDNGSSVPLLSNVFKNVKSLEAHSVSEVRRSLWSCCWQSTLEEMSLYFRLTTTEINFDAIFCGVYPEEVKELQKMDYEFLENVHITPVFPSLLGMTQLKSLYLDVSVGPNSGDDLEAPRFFRTKVTALLAFKRMPNLRTLVEGEGVVRSKLNTDRLHFEGTY